jgi:hypothetical protein
VSLIGLLLLLCLGGLFVAVGMRGFSATGLPLTRNRNITGAAARVIGGICVIVGIIFIGGGLYDAFVSSIRIGPPKQVKSVPPTPDPKPEPPRPEYGLGVPPKSRFISLFDGNTTFGWSDAVLVEGQLTGGSTTTRFIFDFHPRFEVSKPGKIAGDFWSLDIAPGKEFGTVSDGIGKMSIAEGAAVKSFVISPHVNTPLLTPIWDVPHWKWVSAGGKPRHDQFQHNNQNFSYWVPGGKGVWEWSPAQYDNFILQLETQTSRGAKGSIFIRAEAGKPHTGYEISLHNQCENEKYDRPVPASTGSIKGFQDARRLVSRDETVTFLTIIADGPHIARWVNGYQQTDWTDNRPPDSDARKGLRTKPGAIQIRSEDENAPIEIRDVKINAWRGPKLETPKQKK